MTTPALTAALEVFRELGWHRARPEQALELGLGTAEQRKIAVAGLRSGPWGGYEPVPPAEDPVRGTGSQALAWASWVGSDAGMLTLFAIRLGITARRAGELMHHTGPLAPDIVVAVLAERGEAFANAVIATGQVPPPVAVRLVIALELPVPAAGDYPSLWARWGAWQLSPRQHGQPRGEERLLAAKFVEHVEVAVVTATPPEHGLAKLIIHGAQQGWIAQQRALELAFAGLDSAQRPGDRKAWISVLDSLQVTDQQLIDRGDALVPLLAMGEAALVERLAPALIAGVEEAALPEVAISCLTAPTKKSVVVVLKALAMRPMPGIETRQAVAEQVAALAAGRDATVAKAAGAVGAAWQLAELLQPDAIAPKAGVAGWWQPTPAVWTMPRFERGEVSPESLTELAAQLIGRSPADADVLSEQFLAVAQTLAHTAPSEARAALQGVSGWGRWVQWVQDWRDGTRTAPIYDGRRSYLFARDQVVLQRLGEVPCVLSEPSFVDLSIDPGDLLARLRAYAEAGVDALAPDLFLALTRCDARRASAELVATLKTAGVRVVTVEGTALEQTAGQLVADYLVDPVAEPQLSLQPRDGSWKLVLPVMPPSFKPFGVKWSTDHSYYGDYTLAVFPSWGDAGLIQACWSADQPPELGQFHRQLARRREPLTPGLAINVLAGPRGCHPRALAEATQAVSEAWERGLLRPGVADVGLLGWRRPPTAVAAFAGVLLECAEAGMASVVWPVLDDLLVAAVNAPRLLAGASEVAEAMAVLTPEVLAAVADGRAEAAAVEVPGVRALAARPGSSKAVVAAREVVVALPAVEARAAVVTAPTKVLDPPFEAYWDAQDPPLIEDGVAVRADWVDPSASTRMLSFELEVPGQPKPYRVMKGWTWDLEHEGQCAARAPGQDSFADRSWLYWDEQAQAMQVKSERWAEGSEQAFVDRPTPPLSKALLTIVLGLAAQDGDNGLTGRRLVAEFVENGRLGATTVQAAMASLLASPAVSPARLVGVLAKAPHLLGALWPILTEPIRFAGALDDALPSWLNQVLDTANRLAPYLREASARGLLGESTSWPGLAALADRTATAAAVTKARRLRAALGLDKG